MSLFNYAVNVNPLLFIGIILILFLFTVYFAKHICIHDYISYRQQHTDKDGVVISYYCQCRKCGKKINEREIKMLRK